MKKLLITILVISAVALSYFRGYSVGRESGYVAGLAKAVSILVGGDERRNISQ